MNFLPILFLTLTILIIKSETKVLECSYADGGSLGYYCWVASKEFITSKDDREISEIQGRHWEAKNNDDVKCFHSYEKKLNFFPRGLTKFFKNIETVWISLGNLQEIKKDDLMQFGEKLKNLHLAMNEIRVIEGNLFEFNKNLESISFGVNKITHIDTKAFDKLIKLETLYLDENLCTSDKNYFENDRSKVLQVIQDVEKSCRNLI
jgi:hypothetical protein